MNDTGYFTKDGQWISESPDFFKRFLERYAQKRANLKCTRWRKKRTLPENNYYFGVIVEECCKFFGYDKDEMHEILCWKFLRIEKKVGDKIIETRKSTADEDFTTLDAETFYERIRVWMLVDFGVRIPLPNERETNF